MFPLQLSASCCCCHAGVKRQLLTGQFLNLIRNRERERERRINKEKLRRGEAWRRFFPSRGSRLRAARSVHSWYDIISVGKEAAALLTGKATMNWSSCCPDDDTLARRVSHRKLFRIAIYIFQLANKKRRNRSQRSINLLKHFPEFEKKKKEITFFVFVFCSRFS